MSLPLKKLYIKTYGCQMNLYDSGRMIDLLKPLGYSVTDEPEEADLTILNTCHIREKAENKVYSDLGRLAIIRDKRVARGQDMLIGVGGCVGQAEGAEIIKQAPYVSMVFGPQTFHRLPEIIAELHRKNDISKGKKKNRGIIDTDFPIESKFDSLPSPTSSSVSAFLAIQEGCDKFCHFCVVPYTRGSEYSRPVVDILREANQLISQGVKEITLLGQNVNAYHGEGLSITNSGRQEWNLGELILELAKIRNLKRIRYTTSHPRDMHDALYEAHRDVESLMPFLHLPVQSGSDRILNAMNRKHTAQEYLNYIEKLRTARSDMAFSSDFIVGYPGENDQDHQDTLNLISEVGFAQAYSFKYSPRPGTPASVLDCQVPEEVKSKRLEELQTLVNREQINFNQNMVGTVQSVLFDRDGRQENQVLGKTVYMQSVHVQSSNNIKGKIADILIASAHPNSLRGELLEASGAIHSSSALVDLPARGCVSI